MAYLDQHDDQKGLASQKANCQWYDMWYELNIVK